ncbi:hypothetical protein ASD51_18130 [Streptomyces sp. Root55]|nr:hypothetical protein ASD26_10400 [Streptomyces sp. Root1319]KQZ03745.1 hypothetical protein ASD51_18130 [Streptomyces sp. Root55]
MTARPARVVPTVAVAVAVAVQRARPGEEDQPCPGGCCGRGGVLGDVVHRWAERIRAAVRGLVFRPCRG